MPVFCTGQTENQWGVVSPVIENGALQGTPRNSHHVNAANDSGVAGYTQLPVSNLIQMCTIIHSINQ